MCTAISFNAKQHYFGRTLDIERGYDEGVIITPRNMPLSFRFGGELSTHFAMIGIGIIVNDYPLYFDATNEVGLSMAGLNFPEFNQYYAYKEEKSNIAPFELIPYLLGLCSTVEEVRDLLQNINVVDCNFSEQFPTTPLHWLISDEHASITLECTKDGMRIFDNPYGVLTNSPSFDFHLLHVKNFDLKPGTKHLPGDFSSTSRFVKAVFAKENSILPEKETACVSQFMHILGTVSVPKGCVTTPNGEIHYTHYTSCCNTDTSTYYYKKYNDFRIYSVSLYSINVEGTCLCKYLL